MRPVTGGRLAPPRSTIAALLPIYGITLIDIFGYMIMIPLLPYVAQKFGASGLVVGALLAIMAVASTAAAPLWGATSDKLGRKPIVLVSQAVSMIGYLILAWAPSLMMLFVARAVAGIGGGSLGVTQSYIADVTPEEHRDKAYATFGVMFGAGIVLGPVAGGFLVRYGYWVPFVVSAAIEAINIALTLKFLPKTKRARRQSLNLLEAAKQTATDTRTRSLIVRHFLFIFAVTYFFAIFALYLHRALGSDPQQTSWLMAGAGAIGGVTLIAVVGPLVRRLGDAPIAQIGLALSVVAYGLLPFAHTLWTFVGVLAIWAVGASCVEPTIAALLSESAPEDKRGATLGLNDSMSSLALMAAPALGGWILDRQLTLVGLAPALAVGIAFVAGLFRQKEDATLPTATAAR